MPGWRVAAIDLPGHGNSVDASPLSTIPDFVELIQTFATTLNVPRFALAGQSLGAAIALQAAINAPDRISHLILLNGAARIEVTPALLDALQNGDPAIYATLTRLSYARTTSPDRLATFEAFLRRTPPQVLWGAFHACSQFDVTADLPAFAQRSIPALLLASEADRMIPADATRELHAALPVSHLQSIANAGHMLHIEAPAATTDAITNFLNAPSQSA